MKNITTILFLLFTIFVTPAAGQNTPVQFGSRPPIDLDNVPADAYKQGQFRVKFTEAAGQHFDQQPVQMLNGQVVFGIEVLDVLTEAIGLTDARQSFDSPALRNQYTERHRLWGLHLWYDLYTDGTQDVIELVRMFAALDIVDVAEPVYRKQLVAGEVFDWPEEAILRKDDLDEWIPNDPQYGSQWHYHNTGQTSGTPGADISLQQAWTIEKGSPDVIVAIVDDGIQFNHPDLQANMWESIGFNFVDNNANVVPGNHGTHVAGTVAAVSNNGVGVAGVAGGSGDGDGVRLMSAQVFKGTATGGFNIAPVWAADNGAAISQNSWGYTSPGIFEQAVLDAIDYFNANGGGEVMEGGITIFAAGNSGTAGNYYPGFYEGAMSVAATNHNDQRSAYSTYGTWVDISAPGGETTAANNRGVLSTITGSGYAFYQGTSMACPHVSGAAALVLSYAPGVLTAQDLEDILVSTTDNHYDVNPNFIGQLGSGRLNALAALNEVDNFLAGLINPSAFVVAGTGVDEIEISWVPNPDNDPVLLAYSEDGLFGVPEGNYEPGDQISGGGHVLVMDNATGFIHAGLETATTYFYKIWSKKGEDYSSGRMGSASTFCGVYELPFTENFPSTEMPLCWVSSGWQIGSFSEGLNIDGNYAYTASGFSGATNASLFTPIINMSDFEDITISFQHYFRSTFLGGTAGTFSYSTDGGQSWNTLNTWTSTTANPATYQVTIPELAGESMVIFRWNKTINLLGYYWTVGNIAITGTTTTDEKFDVVFNIENQFGAEIEEAVITLDGVENEAGDYLFQELSPDTYNFTVSKYCYLLYEGQLTVSNEDVQVNVLLSTLTGDANGDGLINVLDVIVVAGYFSGQEIDPFCFYSADINGDENIDILDIIGIITIFTQGK